jgi:hypothetical protein
MKTTKNEAPRTVRAVSFGLGGDTVYLPAGRVITGHGRPERPHAADFSRDERQDLIIPDGTPAVDVRAAVETDAGWGHAYKGPILDPDLPAGHVRRLMEPDASPLRPGETPGGLDYAALDIWLAGWRKVGARIGQYSNRSIIWESEAAE